MLYLIPLKIHYICRLLSEYKKITILDGMQFKFDYFIYTTNYHRAKQVTYRIKSYEAYLLSTWLEYSMYFTFINSNNQNIGEN